MTDEMYEAMPDGIRERLSILETKHEDRHSQMISVMHGFEGTQKEIAKAVQQIAVNQGEMKHIGSTIDSHEERLTNVEKTQERHKVVVAVAVFVSCSIFVAVVGWIIP